MFLPIGDDQEHDETPWVTYALLGLNGAAFFLFCFPQPRESVLEAGALVPAHLEPHTLLTSMFLHANLLHLGGNMIFLWVFGRLVEERLGHLAYPFFYLVSGGAADVLHVLTTPAPEAPTFGASGAVSGLIGATLVLLPRANIKVFWWWWTAAVVEIPAVLWILAWFCEQVFFSSLGFGHVAYFAHLGGFAAGAAIMWALRAVLGFLRPARTGPVEPKDSASLAEPRRPFAEGIAGAEPFFLESTLDAFAVVTLKDVDGGDARRLAEIAQAALGEPPDTIARRLKATRGLLARSLRRTAADRVRKDLLAQGIASALIADVPENAPPAPQRVESASWDDRVLRLRLGDQSLALAWGSPVLFLGAQAAGETFIDLFASPKSAFRLPASSAVALTRVDVRRRSEEAVDLRGLAQDILERRGELGPDRGLQRIARGESLGELAFPNVPDYDNYLFRSYHLALSGASSGKL
jgi:membrane associated rhomboid family serine protease